MRTPGAACDGQVRVASLEHFDRLPSLGRDPALEHLENALAHGLGLGHAAVEEDGRGVEETPPLAVHAGW